MYSFGSFPSLSKAFHCLFGAYFALLVVSCSPSPENDQSVILGNQQLENGEIDSAIVSFNAALQRAPKNTFAYRGRGQAYFMNGNFQKALSDLSKAIELNPNDHVTYFYRGTIYRGYNSWGQNTGFKDYSRALADFTEAIRIKPDFAEAYYFRGGVYINMDNMRSGTSDWQKAARLGHSLAQQMVQQAGLQY